MPASNYRCFSPALHAAGSLIASAGEVQRVEAVVSTADENRLPAGTRFVPGQDEPDQ